MSAGCARVASGQAYALPAYPGPSVAGPDWRQVLPPSSFRQQGTGEWVTDAAQGAFDFDELIYSWSAALQPGEGFRLYLQVLFPGGDESPWLYAGYWGEVPKIEKRTDPEFADGRIAMDQLLLDRPARSYRFKVVNSGSRSLETLPALHVVGTDNARVAAVDLAASRQGPATPILDIPLRRQQCSAGNPLPDRCQSAALAAALEYFGSPLATEEIVSLCWDPEYEYPGIWPRTIAAGVQLGFDGYIERFRTWDDVRRTVAMNRAILVSMRMPKGDDYLAPPYASMTGHIIVLNGLTDDGRVIVTDSALGESGRGYRLQWLMPDFEKIWMETKGGVGMVICPPPGASLRAVGEIAPFPADPERIEKGLVKVSWGADAKRNTFGTP